MCAKRASRMQADAQPRLTSAQSSRPSRAEATAASPTCARPQRLAGTAPSASTEELGWEDQLVEPSVNFGDDADIPAAVDHGQFIVCDCNSQIEIDSYDDAAHRAGLAAWGDGIAVFTASHWTDTSVRLSLRRTRPVIDLDAWDHVVEGGIRVCGRAVNVFGPESTATNQASVMIPSGSYSLAVCGTGFATTDEYGDDGSDTYMIWLWPGPILQTRVLKDGLARAL